MAGILQSEGARAGTVVPSSLGDLPGELVLHIASFLASIEDLHRLSCTNKQLQRQLSAVTPNTILRLAARSQSDFFRPKNGLEGREPYLIIAAVARQLSEWAVKSPENVEALRKGFQGGLYPVRIPGVGGDDDSDDESLIYCLTGNVLDLCLEHCGLTMDDIRRLHAYKHTSIDPVIGKLDKWCGKQWRETWNNEVDPASDQEDLFSNATETFYNLAIYGSLFAPCFDSFLDPHEAKSGLDTESRLDYLKYCVPDDNCFMTQHRPTDAPRRENGRLHAWLQVQYDPIYEMTDYINDATEPQIVMRHLLRASKWRKAWQAVRETAGGDFDEEWKQKLWEAVVMFQGFEGMEMLGSSGPGRWRDRMLKWRAQIDALEEQPKITTVGGYASWTPHVYTPEYPMLADELRICTFGYYGYQELANGF